MFSTKLYFLMGDDYIIKNEREDRIWINGIF